MYKRIINSLVYIIIISNLILPFVFAETPQERESISMIEKIMQTAKKDIAEDINRNMDEDFAQLDGRMIANNKQNFRKAVFALIGSLTVVIFGYAFVQNRIVHRFDMEFYEKMIDSKISKLQKYPNVVISDSFYSSTTKTQFEDKFVSPKEYFETNFDEEKKRIKEQDRRITEQEMIIKVLNEKLIQKEEKKRLEKLDEITKREVKKSSKKITIEKPKEETFYISEEERIKKEKKKEGLFKKIYNLFSPKLPEKEMFYKKQQKVIPKKEKKREEETVKELKIKIGKRKLIIMMIVVVIIALLFVFKEKIPWSSIISSTNLTGGG